MSQSAYSGVGAVAVGTNQTVLNLISASGVRPELFELIIGSGATPVDIATIFHIERFTAIGTEGSGFTPFPLNPDFIPSLADYGVAHSVEPTYTANAILLKLSVNQRMTFRWVAAPERGFSSPASASNGVGLQSQSSGGTPVYEATMYNTE